MTAASVLRLLGAGSTAALALVLWRLARASRDLRRHATHAVHPLPAGTPPLVSVLVPARDEERSIAGCVRSLLAGSYPRIELLVLDDDSSDATLAVARAAGAGDLRLRVLRGAGPPPPGWIGKCHALDRLAAEARGDWLLFTDADTVHAPGSVAEGVGFALHHRLEALTCSGEGVLGSFWERAWEPVWPAFLLSWLPPARLADPDAPVAFACGQWLLVSRAAYREIGGHAAVRDAIVEDCALARRLKARRVPFRVLLGTRLFRVRMYRSLREIRAGWGKNAALALRLWGGGRLAPWLGALVLLLVTVAPFAPALARLAGLAPGLGPVAAYGPAVAALGASLALRARGPSSPWLFWSLPLAGGLAAWVLVESAWRVATGRPVEWKGRRYPGGKPAAG